MEPIEFISTIEKVQNMRTTGGFRAYFDIPASHALQAAELMIRAEQTGLVCKHRIEFIREDGDQEAKGLC